MDLLLIHWPYELGKDDFPTHEEAWTMLEGFKDEGLVKSIGVSNYRIKDLETTLKIAKHAITVNQIESHPYVLETSRPLLAFMKQHSKFRSSLCYSDAGMELILWASDRYCD